MAYGFLDIAVTPKVKGVQDDLGVGHLWADFKGDRAFDRFTPDEAAFIAERDSFYMATVSETGWPYVQHRGGRPGFLKVIDETTLAFADYRGNRQYISVGNLAGDGRTALILVDYARRARLKIYARAQVVALDEDPALTARTIDPAYKGRPERLIKLTLEAFDWNCPQHITPRFTEAEIARATQPLRHRVADLESENADLRARLSSSSGDL
jgi:predicted pyridoxine 5'-phosphate oxidase superfamily flavin-nucleotide-binding protein